MVSNMPTNEEMRAPMLPSDTSTQPESKVRKPKPKLWAGLKEHSRVSRVCLALTSAILLWGYDMAMTGNLYGLDEFKKDYGEFSETKNEWSIPSKWLSLWNASSPLGMMLGSIVGGWLQDRFGRRVSLGLGSLTSALGVAVVFVSAYSGDKRQVVLGAGKFTQGLTIGVVVTTTQTYISEVLPSTLRGPLLAFFPIFFLIGQLVSAIICLGLDSKTGRMQYLTAIISEWPFSALPLILAIIMPESPVWLVRKGNIMAAIKAQKRLDSPHMDTYAKVNELKQTVQQEEKKAAGEGAYMDCFKGTDFRRTGLAIFGSVLPQLFGLPILGDGPYFLQKAGMEDTTSFIFLLTGILWGITGTIISMWLLTFIGRRKLVLNTLLPLTGLWLVMGIAGTITAKWSAWIVGVTTNLAPLTASLGVWPASYVITGESSSLRLKAKTTGISWAVGGASNLLFSMGTPYIYNDDAGNLGAKIGYVWVGITGATFVLAYFVLPEMLDRTPSQLDQMFEEKVSARNFSKWTERPQPTWADTSKPAERGSPPPSYKFGHVNSNDSGDFDSMELSWMSPKPQEFS